MRDKLYYIIGSFVVGMSLGLGMTTAAFSNFSNQVLPIILAQENENRDGLAVREPNLELKINYLLVEHGELITTLMRDTYDGRDSKKTYELLEANNKRLSDLVSRTYGEQARGIFEQMWKEQNLEYVNYATGVKTKDNNLKDQSREKLTGLISQMRDTVKAANPQFPEEELANLMHRQVNLMLGIVDIYGQKDQSELSVKKQEVSGHSEKIAEFLVKDLF